MERVRIGKVEPGSPEDPGLCELAPLYWAMFLVLLEVPDVDIAEAVEELEVEDGHRLKAIGKRYTDSMQQKVKEEGWPVCGDRTWLVVEEEGRELQDRIIARVVEDDGEHFYERALTSSGFLMGMRWIQDGVSMLRRDELWGPLMEDIKKKTGVDGWVADGPTLEVYFTQLKTNVLERLGAAGSGT